MAVNIWAILVCGILSMVVGFIWYGPLFGKRWLEIIGATADDLEARKEMQKNAGPLYGIQFVLTLFQVFVLARLIQANTGETGLVTALWIWAGFVVPVLAASSMWNNDDRKISLSRFFIQGGYQLVMFVIFGLVLSLWK